MIWLRQTFVPDRTVLSLRCKLYETPITLYRWDEATASTSCCDSRSQDKKLLFRVSRFSFKSGLPFRVSPEVGHAMPTTGVPSGAS